MTTRKSTANVASRRRSFLSRLWEGIAKTRKVNQLPRRALGAGFESLEDRRVMAVNVLNTQSLLEDSGSAFSATIASFNIPAGNDRLLVVTTGGNGNTVDASATFAGNPLTQGPEIAGSGTNRAEILYIPLGSGPATTGDVVLTYTSTFFFHVTATVFEGVDQTTPVSGGVTGSSASLSVSSATGDYVIDSIVGSGTAITVGSGQTEQYAFDDIAFGAADVGASTEAGAASVTMDWTGISSSIAHAALNIRQTAALPTLSINNVTASEGNSGTTAFTFTVSLDAPSAQTVTVNYSTADFNALAPFDYSTTSGTLTFAPGQTTQQVTVQVVGDTIFEANQTFLVNLSAPVNATIATGVGTGTITNDDAAPTLTINSPTVSEATGSMTFVVTRTGATELPVSVNYSTADGTAVSVAGGPGTPDFTTASGTLTFNPSLAATATQTFNVAINNDSVFEASEQFTANLSGAIGATIVSATGTGTITNDDSSADLVISKTDGATNVLPGGSTTYTIIVRNDGPDPVIGATISDILSPAITAANWTSVAAGGATGNTVASSGNINETVNLPVGSSITYFVSATISPAATGNLSNTATVTTPVGITDPDLSDNSATDTNILDVNVLGTGGNDTLIVNATGPSTGTYSLNGGPAVVFAGISRFIFSGAAGDDTLRINNPAGSIFAPSGGIDYNGGGNAGDRLELLGGGSAGLTETYFVGTTTPPIGSGPGNNGDGLIRFTGSQSLDLRFTGLAPIVDTVVAASLTVMATDGANTINVTNGGVAPRVQVAVDAFEPIDFDNKTTLTINGGDGVVGGDAADTITVNFTNTPTGLTTLTVNADEGGDTVNILALPTAVDAFILGGDGFDLFNVGTSNVLGNPGLLSPIQGDVSVNGGAGGANLRVDGSGAAIAANYEITNNRVERSLPSALPLFGGVDYANISTLLLTVGSGANVINVPSTSVPTTIQTNAGADTINIGGDGTNGGLIPSLAVPRSLDGILGDITIDGGASGADVDTVNINDQDDTGAATYAISGTIVSRTGTALINYNNGANTEVLNVNGSITAGSNVFNVTGTSATQSTTINDGTAATSGTGTFNIQGNAQQATASHTYNGFGGADTFNVNLAAGTQITGTATTINGGDPAADSANRDRVNLNLNAADATVRNVGINYSTTGGSAAVTGLSTGTFDVSATETIVYTGGFDNNDLLAVTGSANGGEVLSVTPISASEANVFLGGNPMLTVPPGTPNNNNPGVAGGAAGPDLSLRGLAQVTGLVINGGGGAADRIVVNAPTETGTGVGFAGLPAAGLNSTVRAANAAFDNITVSEAAVTIVNHSAAGLPTALVQTNIGTGFGTIAGQATVTVNSGDEAAVRPGAFGAGNGAGLVADELTVNLSSLYRFQINAGTPPLPGGAPLVGDRLNITTPEEANVFSDLAAPPNVSITSTAAGNPTQPVTFNNVELLLVTPGNGIVNILGDNNGANPNQADSFTILGRDTDSSLGGDIFGDNEFSLLINGSAPIDFRGVDVLNVASADGDDDIVIDPYADTVRSWGIVTNVDSGAGDDDLFYGNVTANPFVDPTPDGSQAAFNENVVVDVALQPGTGSVTVPGAVTIFFINTEDLSFLLNAADLGDTDTLTINTPDSAGVPETVTVRPDAAGNDADPVVDIDATVPALQLLQIENLALVNQGGAQFFALAIDFNLQNGNDTFIVTPGASGTAINVNGGEPAIGPGDTLAVQFPAGSNPQLALTAGPPSYFGTYSFTNFAPVNFTSFETVQPTVTVTATTPAAAEPATNGEFTLTRTGVTTEPLTVNYTISGTATNGVDFTALTGTVTFAAGSATAVVSVPVSDDTLDENDETVILTLTRTDPDAYVLGLAATQTATVTISDEDVPPVVSISGTPTVTEGGLAEFTVTLNTASGLPVTVTVNTAPGTAAAGADYTTTSQTITFAPGETTKTIGVATFDDLLDEADETFTATLSSPINATLGTATDTATITDNDATPTVSINDATANEAAGTMTFTVTLSAPSGQTVTVDYQTFDGTAIAPADYTAIALGTLTFAPGVTTQTVTVGIINDISPEPVETFTLSLVNGMNVNPGAKIDGIGTIIDDDSPPNVWLSGNTLIISDYDTPPEANLYVLTLTALGYQITENNGTTLTTDVPSATGNGTDTVTVPFGTIDMILIYGNEGDDVLTVDSSNGFLILPNKIHFDGGAGFDRLNLTGGAANESRLNVGALPGSGQSIIDGQIVNFQNIEPVVDNVPAGVFTLSSTPGIASLLDAANAINYTTGQLLATGGRITVDNFEPVEFENKGTLVIDAGAGSDEINLNNPNLPTGLTDITVNGGDPTASDTVIFTGSAGVDIVTVTPTGLASATITGLGPQVVINQTEHFTFSGQGGGDSLIVNTFTSDGSTDILTPATAFDAGLLEFQANTLGNFVAVPIAFRDLGIGGSLTITDVARAERLLYRGTGANDQFSVNPLGDVVLNNRLPVRTPAIDNLILAGLGGDDRFIIPTNHNLSSIQVEGDESGNDSLLIAGSNAATVTLNYETASIVEGAFNPVIYRGIENITLNSGNSVTIRTTTADDVLEVSPTLTGGVFKLVSTSLNPLLPQPPIVAAFNVVGDLLVDSLAGNDAVTVVGTSAADIIAVDRTASTVNANGLQTLTLNAATEALTLASGLADDFIQVFGTGFAGTLTVNAGEPTASDQLFIFTGDGANVAVNFGTDPQSGVVTDDVAGNVVFSGTENMTLIGTGATSLTVNGTNGNDAINQNFNTVTVNNGAVVNHFVYPTLTLNGNNGDDTIHVNPATLAGVTTFTINGGDPTASDTVIVTGTAAADAVTIDQLTLDGGRIALGGAAPVVVATTEKLVYNALGGADAITVQTPAGGQIIELIPGLLSDSANIVMRNFGGSPLLPISYAGIASTGSLEFTDVGGGREDDLQIHGTNESNVFNVTGAGVVALERLVAGSTNTALVNVSTTGIAFLALHGHDGDDVFNIPGSQLITNGILVDGGNPSGGSDVVNLTGAAGAVNVNLSTSTVTGYGSTISLVGIEILNANANGQNLDLNATNGDDNLTVTPTSDGGVTARLTTSPAISAPPVVNASNIATFTVNLLAGSDDLTVVYTQFAETITVTGAAVSRVGLETVNYTGAVNLKVYGQAGSDTFDVTPSVATSIFIDGGDPIGTTGDRINLFPPGASQIQPGPEKDEGGLVAAGMQRVAWDHIEEVTVIGGGPALVLGTNGDDDITVIARDLSTHAGTDGVQDFTVTVNDFFNVLYIDQPALFIDALAGDDDIVVRAPAPNQAEWDVDVTLVGGPAASPTIDQGDVLEFETPGDSTVVFTPTGPETGTFLLDQPVNDSTIAFVNTFTFDPLGINYISSPGGVEQVVYDGVTTNTDTLTINGTLADETLDISSTAFGGTFRSNLSPTLDFSDTGDVTFNGGGGFDVASLSGTAAIDNVTSTGTVVTMVSPGATINFTIGTGVERLNLSTLAGSDNINLVLNVAGLQKWIDAGEGDDIVNLAGTIDATILGGDGNDFLTGSPAYDYIDGGNGRDLILGIGGNDDIYGGNGNDILVGGAGVDNVYGQDDADILVWNPGDGNDLFEGGNGQDILQFVGGAAADTFTVSANGTRLRIDRSPPAVPGQIIIDAAGLEQVDINTSISFGGNLTGTQEVPPVGTAATGQTALVFNAATGTFEIEIVVQGITLAQLTGAHIHQGAVGVNGPVIFDLGTAGWSDVGGSLRRSLSLANFPAANIADLLAGNTYVNIHTGAFPGGEIRGQLTAVSGTPNLNGADTVTVNDLFTTEVVNVNLGLGNADAGAADGVTVNGRTVADNLQITAPNDTLQSHVLVAGLKYNVNVFGAVLADNDRLTVNGNNGADVINAHAPAIETTILLTLNGNDGNDLLTGSAGIDTINGDAGDDIIRGNAGADLLNGGDGEDTFYVDFDTVGDTITGGNDFDTVVIAGTSAANILSAFQTSATSLTSTRQTPPAGISTDVDTIASLEAVRIEAGAGNDTIYVKHAETLEDAAANALLFVVDGGEGTTGDRLIVQDDTNGDLLLQRRADSGSEGSITVGPTSAEPLVTEYANIEYVNLMPANGGDVVVFKYDPYEFNNTRLNATHLGVGETLNADPVIDPGVILVNIPPTFPNPVPADEDWYRTEALQTGTLDVKVFFRQLPNQLPGNGDIDIEITDEDGTVLASDIDATDNARVRIPVVQGEIYYIHVFGKTNVALNSYDISTVNEAAPVPFELELDDALFAGSDTGRSRFDNITNDNTPTIFLRVADHALLNDVPDNGAAPPTAPFDDDIIVVPWVTDVTNVNVPGATSGFRVAVFDTENNTHNPVPLGYASQVVGSPGLYRFTFTTALTDGSHFINARVEMIDAATPEQAQGFGAFSSQVFEIIVDTVAPPVTFGLAPLFGTDGLHADSDSGYTTQTALLNDRITNDLTPTLWGIAEADAYLGVFVDVNDNGLLDGPDTDIFIGATTAIPVDGGDQEPGGYWELTSVISMNAPNVVTALQGSGVIAAGQVDGRRPLLVTALDVAGNQVAGADTDTLDIFIDTQGPRVTGVQVTTAPAYDLFDPKPSTDGPSPLITVLDIDFLDQPIRVNAGVNANFVYPGLNLALAANPGNYRLVGDHNGIIPITAANINVIDATANGTVGLTTVQLAFADPLPDDRYTLTVSDRIGDNATNKLDGNSNTAEPQEIPTFPSGDGVPGGDFVARFTVDSRPEIGVFATGVVWTDTNQNETFDPENTDYVNRDIVYQIGFATDDIFAGNFVNSQAGIADRFDKVAAYGRVNDTFRFLIDTNNDGVPDVTGASATNPNGAPVAGNFDRAHPNSVLNGDEVAVWTGSQWYFDTDHDFIVGDAGNFVLTSALRGVPIVGDFDGDGNEDLGTFKDDMFSFDLSSVGGTLNANLPGLNGAIDVQFYWGLVGTREIPVAADMNRDGFTDIGLYQPDRTGVVPTEGSEWYWLISGLVQNNDGPGVLGPAIVDRPADTDRVVFDAVTGRNVVRYTPEPFGNDQHMFYGDEFSDPIVGNFDPPVTAPVVQTNLGSPYDTDFDGRVTIEDVLRVIYAFNRNIDSSFYDRLSDINRDGTIAIEDVIKIIYAFNLDLVSGEGEAAAEDQSSAGTSSYAAAADSIFADDLLTDDLLPPDEFQS